MHIMSKYFSILMLLSVPLSGMYDHVREAFKTAVAMRYALDGILDIHQLRQQGYDNDYITYAIMEAVRYGDNKGLENVLPNAKYYEKHLEYMNYPQDLRQQELTALNKANDEKRELWMLEVNRIKKQMPYIMPLTKITTLR